MITKTTWDIRAQRSGDREEGDGDIYRSLLQAAEEFDEVEQAFLMNVTPFHESMWTRHDGSNGQELNVMMNQADDRFAEAVNLNIVRGRWFNSEDDGVDWEPVVVSQYLISKTFPGEILSASFSGDEDPENPERDRWRIVGVFDSFRQKGEFSERMPYAVQTSGPARRNGEHPQRADQAATRHVSRL